MTGKWQERRTNKKYSKTDHQAKDLYFANLHELKKGKIMIQNELQCFSLWVS
jgi:hypothetical protein